MGPRPGKASRRTGGRARKAGGNTRGNARSASDRRLRKTQAAILREDAQGSNGHRVEIMPATPEILAALGKKLTTYSTERGYPVSLEEPVLDMKKDVQRALLKLKEKSDIRQIVSWAAELGGVIGVKVSIKALRPSRVKTTASGEEIIHELSSYIRNAIVDGSHGLVATMDLLSFQDGLENVQLDLNSIKSNTAVLRLLAKHSGKNLAGLSMKQNNLSDLTSFKEIKDLLPGLQFLNLSGNHISSVNELQVFKGLDLTEIDLSDNPVASLAPQEYERQIRKLFPLVNSLDGKPLKKVSSFRLGAYKTAMKKPIPSFTMKPAIFHPSAERPITEYLVSYFKKYDSDRSQVAAYYTKDSVFSMAADPSSHPLLDNADSMSFFKSMSRNCNTGTHLESKLFKGSGAIVKALKRFPPSVTILSPEPNADCQVVITYDINEHTVKKGRSGEEVKNYVVTLTGFFEDPQKKKKTKANKNPTMKYYKRAFTRTMILSSPAAGTPANRVGLPFVITNDSMMVRPYIQFPANALPPPAPLVQANGLSASDKAVVDVLVAQSNCTVDVALAALRETQGVLESALNLIVDYVVKGALTGEHFNGEPTKEVTAAINQARARAALPTAGQ